MLRKVESLMMMLSSAYLASFSPPYHRANNMILCSSLNDTCNNNYGTKCGSALTSIYNLRSYLNIGDCTTLGC